VFNAWYPDWVWDYDRLMYAQHSSVGRGMFAGFENYNLAPDGVIPPLPGEAQVLNLDADVVMEPDRLGVYLGQAAGIALYRALAGWGGKLRGYAFGSFICLVSIRDDITLQYWQQTFNNQTVRKFEGTGWVAGGLGFCDADGWKSWETRWWDQPFCWTAGAYLQIRYDEGTSNDGWKVNYSVELE